MPNDTPDVAGPDRDMDALVIGMPDYTCEEFSPEVFKLKEEFGQQIKLVWSGGSCKPIRLAPKLTEDCVPPDVIDMPSNIQFNGTMVVFEKGGGYNLKEGEMIYHAFRGPCGEFPGSEVRAIGIKLKPHDFSEAEIQAKIETGDFGELLARIHIWNGNAQLVSFDGEEFLDLVAGMQVLVDKDLNVIEAFKLKSEEGEDVSGSNNASDASTINSVIQNPETAGGCQAEARTVPNLDLLVTTIGVLMIARALRAGIKMPVDLKTMAGLLGLKRKD